MLAAQGEGPVSEGDGVVSLLFGFYATPPGGWGVLLGLERSHVVVPPGGFAPGALGFRISGYGALAGGVGLFHSLQSIVDLLQGDLRGIYLRGSCFVVVRLSM